MSEDPKLFDAGLPAVASAQAGDYNLYRYCHNDPLDMTDPMGWASTTRLHRLRSGRRV
jgi:hypothetical protein